MISCEVFRRHVDAIVDGEVDPTTQIEFEQHLSECGPCRVHLSFATSIKRQVRDGAREASPPAPGDLAARIRQALIELHRYLHADRRSRVRRAELLHPT